MAATESHAPVQIVYGNGVVQQSQNTHVPEVIAEKNGIKVQMGFGTTAQYATPVNVPQY